MGEWRTVFQRELDGRPVEIRVYETQDDRDEDPSKPVRITTVLKDRTSEQVQNGRRGGPERTITIEPYILDDLDEELAEIGFSREAAAQIVSMVRE